MTFHLLLILIALACFGAAAVGAKVRVNLVALGLFCWLLAVTFVA